MPFILTLDNWEADVALIAALAAAAPDCGAVSWFANRDEVVIGGLGV